MSLYSSTIPSTCFYCKKCYDPRGVYIWLNLYDMTLSGGIHGPKYTLMCKYICNRVFLVIKGPHVQVWITIYKRSCIHYWDMNCEVWKIFGYLEGVPLLFKELMCKLSIFELCSTFTLCTWCVLLLFFDILTILDHNIWYKSSRSWGFASTSDTPWNCCYNLFSMMFHKEIPCEYLLDGSRYMGFKFHLPRPYNFRDIPCVI